MAHACSWLEQHGYKPKVVDSLALKQTHQEFYRFLELHKPDLLCMEISSFSMENDLQIAKQAKKLLPKLKVIFMGLANEMEKEEFVCQHSEVDYFLVGEYEDTLLELVQKIEKKEKFDSLLGCTFMRDDGSFSGFQRRPLQPDINVYPWPSRNQLPMLNYHDEPGNISTPSVQMWASRGCPFKCIFCAWPQIMYGNNDYRTRDIVDLADEFEWLVKEWGFKSVYFDDDTFNVNKRRITAFCNELIRRGLSVPWAAMSRADLVDEKLLKVMRESGVQALKFGIESADQNAVDNMEKSLNLTKAVQNIRLTHNYGIKTHLSFMFGLPGESRESCEKTLQMAKDLNPESLQFTVAAPFPGSKFMKHLEEKGHLVGKVTDADGFRTSVVRTEAMSHDELEDFVSYAQNQWLIHKARQKPRLGVGAKLKRNGKSLVSVIIPNFNGEAFIRNSVHSVLHQSYPNVEVIVVDNGSQDKSLEILRSHFPEVEVLEFPKNEGFAYAVNAGIEVANGEYIALLNNDAKADKDWIKNLVRALEDDSRVGFAASKVLCHANPKLIDSAGDGVTSVGRTFNVGHLNNDDETFDKQRWVFGATGAAVIYKRSVIEDVGAFDSDFFMYLEDVDYSFRCQIRGHKCMYVPEAKVTHIGSATADRFHGFKTYYMTRNYFALLIKNFPKNHLKSVIPGVIFHLLFMAAYHLFKSGTSMAYIKGLKDGIKMIKPSLSKRKINLGARRLTDDEFGQLFFFGDHNWHLTRKNQCKPPSKHHIEITKASPEKA